RHAFLGGQPVFLEEGFQPPEGMAGLPHALDQGCRAGLDPAARLVGNHGMARQRLDGTGFVHAVRPVEFEPEIAVRGQDVGKKGHAVAVAAIIVKPPMAGTYTAPSGHPRGDTGAASDGRHGSHWPPKGLTRPPYWPKSDASGPPAWADRRDAAGPRRFQPTG